MKSAMNPYADVAGKEERMKKTTKICRFCKTEIPADANALAKAKTYQDTMSMSPEAIRDQLTSEYGEKFTAEEAEYVVSHL